MPTFQVNPCLIIFNRRADPKIDGHLEIVATSILQQSNVAPEKDAIPRIIIYKFAVNVSSPSFSISNIVWFPPGMKPPATLGRPLPPNTMNLEVQTTTDEFRCVFRRPFVNARVCRFGFWRVFRKWKKDLLMQVVWNNVCVCVGGMPKSSNSENMIMTLTQWLFFSKGLLPTLLIHWYSIWAGLCSIYVTYF